MRIIAGAVALLLSVPAFAQQSLPDPTLTPGAINPAVTQENIHQTICVPGWSASVRPAAKYMSTLKAEQIVQYGYSDTRKSSYEADHLISLELGGAPYDPRNLWPEPWEPRNGWGAETKDRLENTLHRLVCRGQIPLAQAQSEIASNWIAAYRKYVGE